MFESLGGIVLQTDHHQLQTLRAGRLPGLTRSRLKPALQTRTHHLDLKRKGFSREAISEILEAHRLYFRADLNSDEALRIIEETYGDRKEIREFLDFMVKTDGTA